MSFSHPPKLGLPPHSLSIVVEVKQGYATCKILPLHQSHYLVSVEFHGDHKTVTKMRYNLTTINFWDVATFKTVVSGENLTINIPVFFKHTFHQHHAIPEKSHGSVATAVRDIILPLKDRNHNTYDKFSWFFQSI